MSHDASTTDASTTADPAPVKDIVKSSSLRDGYRNVTIKKRDGTVSTFTARERNLARREKRAARRAAARTPPTPHTPQPPSPSPATEL